MPIRYFLEGRASGGLPPSDNPDLSKTPFSGFLEALVAAVEEDRIFPLFQPVVSLQSGLVSGFEVLARWNDPSFGEISPSIFIRAAQVANVLDPLLASVIRQSCAVASTIPGDFLLSFNVTPLQLLHPTLPRLIQEAAGHSNFALNRISIEIVEEAVFEYHSVALDMANRLRGMGMGLAMDDFGTGYSSLTRLSEFPFTDLKIDASFVSSMVDNPGSSKIINAILSLGKNLDLKVVVEGIETKQQHDMLQAMGAAFGQGYYFHKGLTGEQLSAFMQPA